MKTIGYMEGTDSDFLTNLLVDGVDTLPLSNGWDNHGKFVAHITKTDNISVVVGYLHKFFALSKDQKIVEDILSSLKVYKIPTVFIVPKDHHGEARKLLKSKGINCHFSDPLDLTKTVAAILRVKLGAKNTTEKKARKTAKRKK